MESEVYQAGRLPQKKLKLNYEKALQFCSIFMIFIIMLMVLNVHVYAQSIVSVVYLDGREMGCISDEEALMSFIAQLCLNEGRYTGLDVMLTQEITVQQEHRSNAKPDDAMVRENLLQNLEFEYYGYMIMINNRPTLAVHSLSEYDKVLNLIEQAYVSDSENAVVQAVMLNEEVDYLWSRVEPGQVYSADAAAEILLQGTDQRKTYLVSRGDSLWSIARNHNMTIEDVKRANPHLESDKIRVGEELNLVVAEPLVHVQVTEEVTVQEKIPFDVKYQNDSKLYKGTSRVITAGREGVREVTYRITRVSGREVEREVLSETVLEEPKTQVVAQGTAVAPVTGSGRFLWPVSGGGRITSRYGQRGRSFHYGVDIAAAKGTPVVAADDGVVTHSGWAGSYGILVTIDHGNGYVTKYAHNSQTLVSVGQKVKKGAQIAKMGSTGNSTGPHVHFEVLKNGKNVNPLSFF